ncbi:MAG: iron-containing alcohol dehydrogenase [Pseudomonadales bacterium]|nr:iron-containing alcohol dehydrogenase [Pseudomonadales bacterium]
MLYGLQWAEMFGVSGGCTLNFGLGIAIQWETRLRFNYSALETVILGEPVAEALPKLAEENGVQRLFLVASSSLAQATNQLTSLTNALGDRCVGLSTDIGSHTPRQDVLAVLEKVRSSKADLLVAVGGGSVIDGCKIIQLAIDQDIQSAEQLLEFAQRADGSRGPRFGNSSMFFKRPKIRQVAVPTTLSGAEFSNAASALDIERQAKEGYRAPSICAQSIVYDPALTLHTPQWLFLSTAVRSLDHAIEGYCSVDSTPYHDSHFLSAIRLFSQALPKVVDDPDDLAARGLSQQAVWHACCGLGTVAHGASHGIGYILGSLCGVPHGYTSCVMLPAVLRWNSSENSERQSAIAEALGEDGEPPATLLQQLVERLQLPVSLQAVGVKESQLEEIAERAFQHPVVKRNPKPITRVEQVREILELAWDR